jgi:hypothetical protein
VKVKQALERSYGGRTVRKVTYWRRSSREETFAMNELRGKVHARAVLALIQAGWAILV